MPAAIMRWWQMIHNGGAPTAIGVPPSEIPNGSITDPVGGASESDPVGGAYTVDPGV